MSGYPVAGILSVYRDGVLYRQAELADAGLRIGRGPENDVVLEDPLKRVSRAHAELRLEEGVVTLSDLHSADGTLVDGVPIASAELALGQSFSIGPYVLTWDTQPSSNGEGNVSTLASVPDAGDPVTIAPPASVPIAQPAVAAAPAGPPSRINASGTVRRRSVGAVLIAVAVLAVIASAAVIVRKRSAGDEGRAHIDAARQLVRDGRPEDAIRLHLDAVPPDDPAREEAQRLRAQAETMIKARTAAAAPVEPAQGEPAAVADPPPEPEPAPLPAEEAPPTVRTSGMEKKRAEAPAYPLLERRRGESAGSWQNRSRAAWEEYNKAAAAEQEERFDDAIRTFEGLEAAEPGYRDVSTRLEGVRARQSALAHQLLDQGVQQQRRGEFGEALLTFEHAHRIAPGLAGVAERITEARVAKGRACQQAYDDGLNYYNAGRYRDAGQHLTRALALCDDGSSQHHDSAELMRAMEPR